MVCSRKIPPSARFSLPAAVFHRDGQSGNRSTGPGGRPIIFALLNFRIPIPFPAKKWGRTRDREQQPEKNNHAKLSPARSYFKLKLIRYFRAYIDKSVPYLNQPRPKPLASLFRFVCMKPNS